MNFTKQLSIQQFEERMEKVFPEIRYFRHKEIQLMYEYFSYLISTRWTEKSQQQLNNECRIQLNDNIIQESFNDLNERSLTLNSYQQRFETRKVSKDGKIIMEKNSQLKSWAKDKGRVVRYMAKHCFIQQQIDDKEELSMMYDLTRLGGEKYVIKKFRSETYDEAQRRFLIQFSRKYEIERVSGVPLIQLKKNVKSSVPDELKNKNVIDYKEQRFQKWFTDNVKYDFKQRCRILFNVKELIRKRLLEFKMYVRQTLFNVYKNGKQFSSEYAKIPTLSDLCIRVMMRNKRLQYGNFKNASVMEMECKVNVWLLVKVVKLVKLTVNVQDFYNFDYLCLSEEKQVIRMYFDMSVKMITLMWQMRFSQNTQSIKTILLNFYEVGPWLTIIIDGDKIISNIFDKQYDKYAYIQKSLVYVVKEGDQVIRDSNYSTKYEILSLECVRKYVKNHFDEYDIMDTLLRLFDNM
jgi:hypothetical protein